jgi:DNA polymerase III alpha subunit
LEVNHKDHQFYLSNNVLTSNSHAIVYSFISYETAYLKANFTKQFLLANLKQKLASVTEKAESTVSKIKHELKLNGVKILPPTVNNSLKDYKVKGNKLITGLSAIKSVGDDAIEDIIQKQPYKSLDDFLIRVDHSKVRANTIQALAASGCFDEFKISRKTIFHYIADYNKKYAAWNKKKNKEATFQYNWPIEQDWNESEKYALEMKFMNESFCNVNKAYNGFFNDSKLNLSNLEKMEDRETINSCKVIVRDYFEMKVKKEGSKLLGRTMAKLLIEDIFGNQGNLTIFPESLDFSLKQIKLLTNSKVKLEPGIALHFSGSVNYYNDEAGIILDKLYAIASKPAEPIDIKIKKTASKLDKKEDVDIFEEIEKELFDEWENI